MSCVAYGNVMWYSADDANFTIMIRLAKHIRASRAKLSTDVFIELPDSQEVKNMRLAILTRTFWKLTLFAGALVMACSYCSAHTILAVTDSLTPPNRASFYIGGSYSNVVASSWTQTASFSGVTIDASLGSVDPGFTSGTAYLMSAIGPGTTPASEVDAPVNFTVPVGSNFGSVPLTVLFSGLNLGPGTYYLVHRTISSLHYFTARL
jgi:hypothetical protein